MNDQDLRFRCLALADQMMVSDHKTKMTHHATTTEILWRAQAYYEFVVGKRCAMYPEEPAPESQDKEHS